MTHSLDIRVYYEDTDSGGVVYYANYLKFAERARSELLRSLGFENKSLCQTQGIVFVVRHIAADYLAPAGLDDLLGVKTHVSALKKASVVMKQDIFEGSRKLFEMSVKLACLDEKTRKPIAIPDEVRKGFETCLK